MTGVTHRIDRAVMTTGEKKALKKVDEHYRAASLAPKDVSPSVIYHYTSAVGLHGIIKGGVLRATNFGYLNDSSEIHHGRKIATNVISQQLAKEQPRTHRQVLTTVQPALNDVGRGREFYLACFCEKGDLLSQWRAYGSAKDRFCIGFATEDLPGGMPYRFNRVVYRRKDQESRIRQAINEALSVIGNDMPSQDFLDQLADLLAEQLIAELVFFKDWSFRDEREWRAVYTFRPSDDIQFDTSGGFMRPFVDLWVAPRSEGRRGLPVTEIVASTSRSVRSVELLLGKHGYSDVPVRSSNVPYQEL